jgi:hypothetical protein
MGAFRREALPRLGLAVDDDREGVAVVYRFLGAAR